MHRGGGRAKRGACPECGAPWGRVTNVEQEHIANQNVNRDPSVGFAPDMPKTRKHVTTTGWQSGCDHAADPIPCVTLDPFAGSGTVGLVAAKMNRSAILIELNPEYAAMAERRIRPVSLFGKVTVNSVNLPTERTEPPPATKDKQAGHGPRHAGFNERWKAAHP